MKHSKNQKENNNNLILSKNAINFLNNQKINIFENKITEMNFIFKINYIIKKIDNWYGCCLSDEDSKFDGFYVDYQNGELKKDDIIQTNKINIFKLPNRDTNLLFCEKVKKINNNNKEQNISQNNIDINDNKKTISKDSEIFENIKNENIFFNTQNNINTDITNQKNKDNNNVIIKNNTKPKKYTLISNLTIFTNNPTFLLKCKFKSGITTIFSNGSEIFIQNYIFFDTNGEEIQAVCYHSYVNYFNDIITVDSVYEISKAERIKNNPDYNLTMTKSIFQLLFKKNTKIKKVKDNGEFDNVKNIQQEFIKIEQLINLKNNLIVNIIAIILDDKGITQIHKDSREIISYRNLIIGDNTLYKINMKLWENKIQKEKNYSKGDIVCIYYAKYKKYNNIYELNSISSTEILPCNDIQKEKELKNFYLKYQDINEYIDINTIG